MQLMFSMDASTSWRRKCLALHTVCLLLLQLQWLMVVCDHLINSQSILNHVPVCEGDSDHDSGVSSNSTVPSSSSDDSPGHSRANTPDLESNSSPLFVVFPPLEVSLNAENKDRLFVYDAYKMWECWTDATALRYALSLCLSPSIV